MLSVHLFPLHLHADASTQQKTNQFAAADVLKWCLNWNAVCTQPIRNPNPALQAPK